MRCNDVRRTCETKFRSNLIYLGCVLICLNERNNFDGLLSAINCL